MQTATRRVSCGQANPHEIRNKARTTDKRGNAARQCIARAKQPFLLAAVLVSTMAPTWAQQKPTDLASQSLEELMSIQVTSVSRTEQPLSRTASAIFVITQQDIQQSGATNMPDLLRMVPGMDVAQINANTWAVSARGFNRRFSNNLLVLVDGQSVYTQTFGGVYWDVLDLALEDILRVEVIRGPGGSVWGANAVNGVINIITKKASDTHGALLAGGGGNFDRSFGTAQYGGKAWANTDYRVYSKYFDQDHLPIPGGQDGGDGWHMLEGGFRADSTVSSKNTLIVQGNIYSAREGIPTIIYPSVTAPGPMNIEQLGNLSGGFIQGVWGHTFSARSGTTLQISYNKYTRDDILRESRGTYGLDFQHHYSGWARQDIVWGATYQYSVWNSEGNLTASFAPPDLNTQQFGSFVQDEIAIVHNRLFLTVGSKLEHNYYTGFALMPSARVAWIPSSHHTLWAAISRAERTPSALDTSARSTISGFPGPGGIPSLVTFVGNPLVKNEALIGYEAGYRTTVLKQLTIDLAAYYNDYYNQESTEPAASFMESAPPPPHLILPITYENLMHGETHGIEVAVNWQATRRWTLSPGYAFEQIHMHLSPLSQDTTAVPTTQGSSPVNSAQLRSHYRLWHGLSWDASAYFVGPLSDPKESSYTRLDTGISWQFGEGVSLSFVGQSLANNHHEEFSDASSTARTTFVKRSAYAKFAWRF